MNYSRKQLERLGEPLGESVTRIEPGRRLICGGGGGGSSSSSTTTTTNIDRRQVVDNGGIGLSSDSSTINVEALDGNIVNAALDVVKSADATAGEGFMRLLDLSEKLFQAGGQILDKTSETSMQAVQAVNSARNDADGKIDQKTLIILGAVGLGAAYVMKKGK